MSLTNLLPLVMLFGLLCPMLINSQSTHSDELDSVSQIMFQEVIAGHNDQQISERYKERRDNFRYDLTLFKKTIEHFLGKGEYELVSVLLKTNPFLFHL